MKDFPCCKQKGLSSMFHPTLVSFVMGMIMITAGVGKFLGGTKTMTWVGGSVLEIFHLDPSAGVFAMIALVLGYFAASIEVIGGVSFALGCRKTSKYASFALALVMVFALAVHIRGLENIDGTGFKMFTGILSQIQMPLLLLAIFMKKSNGMFGCCKASSCCNVNKGSCEGGKSCK